MMAGSVICRVSSSKRASIPSSLCENSIEAPGAQAQLSDNQFAALCLFELKCAFKSANRNSGLIVRRRLGSNPLQPKPGRGEGGHQPLPVFCREANEFIAQHRNQRQQGDASQEFREESIEG